jgi:hypothetical protein
MLATRLVGATSAASTLPTLTWIGATSIVSTTSSFTFSGVDIGTPSPSRLVIVGASAYNSTSRRLNSVTIAGNSTTAHIGTAVSASFPGGIVSRADFTNSTADIVVNFTGNCTQCAIFVWVATNLDSNTPIEALTDSGVFSLSLDVEDDGPYVALVRAATSSNISWTGITEDVDGVGSSGIFASAASAIATSTTTQTITARTFSASRGFAVSWR